MNMPRMFQMGRDKKNEAAQREREKARKEEIDEKRQVFETTMKAAELADCLKVPYENRLLRAVVQVIRTQAAVYAARGMQKPMDEAAHEMTARQAALWELEETLLGQVDGACERVEGGEG